MDSSLKPALLAHLREKGFAGCNICFWSICNKPSDVVTFGGVLDNPWLLIEKFAAAEDLPLLKPIIGMPGDERTAEIRISSTWSEKDPALTTVQIKLPKNRSTPTGHEAIIQVRRRDALARMQTTLEDTTVRTRSEMILIARDIVCH